LRFELRYALSARFGQVERGSGRVIDLSSSGLRFTSDRPLTNGLRLDISIDWPVPLDGGVGLQLIMSGVVVRTNGTETVMAVRRHQFRTRGLGVNAALD
jgi:hypothetical protein